MLPKFSKSFSFERACWCLLKKHVTVTTSCDKIWQSLVTGLWFSPGTPMSSTNKIVHHDIAEMLLKVALNTITLALNCQKDPTTTMVIDTDCIGSCKSNYHTITATTANNKEAKNSFIFLHFTFYILQICQYFFMTKYSHFALKFVAHSLRSHDSLNNYTITNWRVSLSKICHVLIDEFHYQKYVTHDQMTL
jgi:hypothetical protein